MKKVENFCLMSTDQLRDINGGGFAYDVGRIIRFLGISAGQPIGTLNALADWEINKIINEIENA